MGPEGTAPVDPARPAAAAAAAASPARSGAAGDFARLLRDQLAEPRDRVAQVRAAIDAIRQGAMFRAGGVAGGVPLSTQSTPTDVQALFPYRAEAGEGSDPFGWRSRSRSMGDEIVGAGFGAIFERQIDQESGFSPEVAFGLRRSSAGAEGIAQLMPEYYPAVDRADPEASLQAAARTMRHYLTVFDGDVRKALASYNAGMGRVQSLVAAHGDGWERALPAETRRYLQGIVGAEHPRLTVDATAEVAVFGGRGPGGVLTSPLGHTLEERTVGALLDLLAAAGVPVRAPADGRVASVEQAGAASVVVLDHGNGWRSSLTGLTDLLVAVGENVRRSEPLGALAEGLVDGQGRLRMGLDFNGRALPPARYLLST